MALALNNLKRVDMPLNQTETKPFLLRDSSGVIQLMVGCIFVCHIYIYICMCIFEYVYIYIRHYSELTLDKNKNEC